jgi:aldose sugar dehydrogenase
MSFIQTYAFVCLALFGLQAGASPLNDSHLADQALAIIGARVPNSTQKCAGCHRLDAPKIRAWVNETARVQESCLDAWANDKSSAQADASLACLSLNSAFPLQWSPKKLGLWTGRVNSDDFSDLFRFKYANKAERELNRFRQRTYMPRSGAPGFTDDQWVIVSEYVSRGAPLLEEKLNGPTQQERPVSATVEDIVLLNNLNSPWAVVPSPDGQVWITESDGQILVFDGQYRLIHTLTNLPDIQAVGQGGLLDLAFHPQYLQNGWIYVAYTVRQNNGYNTQINRFTFRNGSLIERKKILDGPSGTDSAHFGCRLVFDSAGYLYATFGDRHQKEKAQNINSLHGKTVRLHEDGRVPADNPIANNPIYTLGHRNPQGLDIHPVSKSLVVSEHGPTGYDAPGGGDEINILKPGANYGWPEVHHRMMRPGMESPLQEYTPSIAPSGSTFYTGTKIPQWKNDFFVAALAGSALHRLTIDSSGRLRNEEKLLEDKYGRLRDVGNAPDGTLLVISDSGKLIQLRPR